MSGARVAPVSPRGLYRISAFIPLPRAARVDADREQQRRHGREEKADENGASRMEVTTNPRCGWEETQRRPSRPVFTIGENAFIPQSRFYCSTKGEIRADSTENGWRNFDNIQRRSSSSTAAERRWR